MVLTPDDTGHDPSNGGNTQMQTLQGPIRHSSDPGHSSGSDDDEDAELNNSDDKAMDAILSASKAALLQSNASLSAPPEVGKGG
jgi:hypothetical protein